MITAFFDGVPAPVRFALSLSLSLVPILGDAYDLYTLATGVDVITGQRLSDGERLLLVLTLLPGITGHALHLGRGLSFADEVADIGHIARGADEEAREAIRLQLKVQEIHGALGRRARSTRTTAVLRARTPDGRYVDIVASSERNLTRAQRALLRPEDMAAIGEGHAEMTALNHALLHYLTPLEIAASRPICPVCAQAIFAAG